jgi:hypothetical protein
MAAFFDFLGDTYRFFFFIGVVFILWIFRKQIFSRKEETKEKKEADRVAYIIQHNRAILANHTYQLLDRQKEIDEYWAKYKESGYKDVASYIKYLEHIELKDNWLIGLGVIPDDEYIKKEEIKK